MNRLLNKLCVITGGSSGIGQGIAVLFAEHGAKLVLLDIQSFSDTISQLPSDFDQTNNLLCVKCDISNEKNIMFAMKEICSKFQQQRIDILINNAARFIFRSVLSATNDDWQQTMDVNIKGHALMMKHVIPLMRKGRNEGLNNESKDENETGGSIILMCSISSFIAQPTCATYAVCKAAMLQMMKNTALDVWSEYKIRVNAVCPGTIYTSASEQEIRDYGWTFDEWEKDKNDDQIIKRNGTTREVAYACLFFASDDSSFCTGSTLSVDGGQCAL